MTLNTHWFHDHHWHFAVPHLHPHDMLEWLKDAWIGVLIVLLGVTALVSAIILAYPVLAHLAAKFFQ